MSGVDPSWGWQAVLFIAGAMVLLDRGLALVDRRRPQLRNVRMEEDVATKNDIKAANARIDQVDAKVETLKGDIVRNGEVRKQAIEARVEAARKEASDSNRDLLEKIIEVGKQVAALSTETRITNQSVTLMQQAQNRRIDK